MEDQVINPSIPSPPNNQAPAANTPVNAPGNSAATAQNTLDPQGGASAPSQQPTAIAGAANFNAISHSQIEARERVSLDRLFELIFIVGFASIFLINALQAWVQPAFFASILHENPFVPMPGFVEPEPLVKFVAFNDLFLGIMILTGKLRKYVWTWAGIWFMIIAITKLGYLFY